MPDTPANRMLLSSPTKIEFQVKGGDLIVSQEFDLITLLRIIECKRAKSGKRYVSNLYVQNLIVSLIDRFTNLSESVKKLFRGKEVMLSICYTIPRSPTMDADEKHIMHHNISFSNGKDHHCQTLSLDGCPIKQKYQIGVLKEIAPGIKNITVAIKIKGPEDIAKLKRFLQEHGIMPKKITSRSPSPSPVSWLKQLEEDAASPTASDDSEFTDSESETDSATSSRSMTPLSRFSKSPMSISRTSSLQHPQPSPTLLGAFFPTTPEKLVKRTIRGMLPYKQYKGKTAHKKIKCHVGVPEKLKSEKFQTIEKANIKKLPTFKYITVQEVCKFLRGK